MISYDHVASATPSLPNNTMKASRSKDGRNTEIVFVLDCSGYMSGSSIAEARQALNVFLKGMIGSMQFNIYRFGSRFERIFEASKPYTEDHLNRAVNYLSDVDADLGGTELLASLQTCHSLSTSPGLYPSRSSLCDQLSVIMGPIVTQCCESVWVGRHAASSEAALLRGSVVTRL